MRIPEQLAPEPAAPSEPAFPGIQITPTIGPKSGRGKGAGAKGSGETKQKSKAHGGASGTTDTGDIPLIRSGLYGLAATAVFLVLTLPVRHLGIFQLIWDRGPIPFATLLLTMWSFAILILKWRKLKQQREAMLLDVLPTELSREITLDSLDEFQEHIYGLPGESRQSFLVNRVIRGLEHFRVRRSAAETVTMMESQSDIDANNVASSYTIVKVFIWALPILGFIGTVIGVSSAVASLAGSLESATDISAVKDSLKDVFGGLGVAFDTTLLALVFSLMVKIPQSALQKSEEDLVTWVDEYCNENVLKRLNDGREVSVTTAAGTTDAEVFRKVVQAAMTSHQAELLRQYEQRLAETSRLADQVQDALSSLGDRAQAIQKDMAESIHGTGQALQEHFAGIERGLLGLNRVLEKLGEQQIVVQQVEKPRWRWFGLGG